MPSTDNTTSIELKVIPKKVPSAISDADFPTTQEGEPSCLR